MIKVYAANVLTGGVTGALDKLDGNNLNAGDMAIVITNDDDANYPSMHFLYTLDADCTAPVNQCTESVPDVITPDTNPGNKRWILTDFNNLTVQGPTLNKVKTEYKNELLETVGETFIQNNILYTGDRPNGLLKIYSLSDPMNPTLISSTAISGSTGARMYVAGKYLYFVSTKLEVYDVTDLKNPLLKSATTLTARAAHIYVQGRVAYLTLADNSIEIYSIEYPNFPFKISTIIYGTNRLKSATARGQYLYFTQGADTGTGVNSKLVIYNISNLNSPTLVSDTTLAYEGGAAGLEVVGDYAYVSMRRDGSFKIIDIRDKSNPSIVGSVVIANAGGKVDLAGDYAFVGTYPDDRILYVIDISDKANPKIYSQLNLDNYTSGSPDDSKYVTIDGRYIYVSYVSTGASELVIVDIGGISTPALETGTLKSTTIDVGVNATIGNDLNVVGGSIFGKDVYMQDNLNVNGGLRVGASAVAPAYGTEIRNDDGILFQALNDATHSLYLVTATGDGNWKLTVGSGAFSIKDTITNLKPLKLNEGTSLDPGLELTADDIFHAYGGMDIGSGKVFKVNGVPGLSDTYTFGGGASGDIASMTFTGGILTGVTTVP